MAVPAMAQNLTDLSTLCRAGGLRARQEIRCAFWRERRAGRCKAPRRRRCSDIVEERQRRRCPPAAAPLRAAARRPPGCVARSLHTAAGMLVARALPAGLGASSKMYTLFPDGPLAKALAGGERKRTPGIVQHEFAPAAAGVRGDPATPAGVRIVVPLLPGSSLRSPPANPVGAGVRYRIYEAQQSMALGE